MEKSYFEFKHVYYDTYGIASEVSVKVYGMDTTWSQLTREFVNYLRGCDFSFTNDEFVDSVVDEYGGAILTEDQK